MFIHFEDWSAPMFLSRLDGKGMPHAGRIIKAYATGLDPRGFRPSLTVFESDSDPFSVNEVFRYDGRESYFGPELEAKLEELGLRTVGKDTVRALFRFANRSDARFCQAAMAAEYEGKWLFQHPFQDLDGLEVAKQRPQQESGIHLDLFFPASVQRLRGLVNIDDPREVLRYREHPALDKFIAEQGRTSNPER